MAAITKARVVAVDDDARELGAHQHLTVPLEPQQHVPAR